MKINATEIRVGMILEHKDDLWEVLKTQHVKPGKGGAFAQVEMKSLNKSTKLNERFRSNETIEKAMEYLGFGPFFRRNSQNSANFRVIWTYFREKTYKNTRFFNEIWTKSAFFAK